MTGHLPHRAALPQMTDRLPIGQTGLLVSPFCLGWVQTPETIEVAFDAGINFFFLSADMHWPVYDASRRGLIALLNRGRAVREQIVVAVASYVTQREFTYKPFLEALEAVPKLKRIDMIVIGGAYENDFAIRQEIYRRHVEQRAFGARAVGTSFHDRAAAVTAANDAQIDVAFIRYNPVHPGARLDVFPRLQPSPTRIFNFKSTLGYIKPSKLRAAGVIAGDNWQPSPTDYYRFALSQPSIDGILCSLRHPREIKALARALKSPPLDAEEERYLIELAKLWGRNLQPTK